MADDAKQAWSEVGEKFATWGRGVADRYREAESTDAGAAKESQRELERTASELMDELSRGSRRSPTRCVTSRRGSGSWTP